MIGLYIITVILLLLIGFLIMPIKLSINTGKNKYQISQPIYFGIRLSSDERYILKVRLRILIIAFNIYPFKYNYSKRTKKKESKQAKRTKTGMKPQMIKAMLRNFKIKRMAAELDTGNFPLNAQLMPIAQQLNGKNRYVRINFQNQNSIDLLIVTQLYKFILTAVRHKVRK